MFVQKKFERPTAERRMKKANFDKESMRLTYSIPFKVAKDIRLAIFQFSLRAFIIFYPLMPLFSGIRLFKKSNATFVTRNKHWNTFS